MLKDTLAFGEKDSRLEYTKREGCYAVIIDVNRHHVAAILTTRGHYFLPGGGMEAGESPEECLRRELLEETGYEVSVGSYIGKAQRYFITPRNEPLLQVGNFFMARFVKKVQKPINGDHDLKWIVSDEVDELLFHEHHAWAVKKAVALLRNHR
ncbi:NUDIX hydrolase [Paenibacillus allorhizosphaerae]|uniref:Nudix hydrolase domain-containing protein n=1 Tax=Paenibacillus allorhizosphaerae TaxID=2849866 RepID=A0ABN7TP34_9BACL|nr:NUDIX domain-containing protein [Paenibacillus allorhizosphaerae]CAG7644297.1 hypothetical protein PAECIP111802_03220 [Paenibacillus allorhizosphaerae]